MSVELYSIKIFFDYVFFNAGIHDHVTVFVSLFKKGKTKNAKNTTRREKDFKWKRRVHEKIIK